MPITTARKSTGGKAPRDRQEEARRESARKESAKRARREKKEHYRKLKNQIKRASLLSVVAVTVKGSEEDGGIQKTFEVNFDDLVNHSEFFRTALTGHRWKEGMDKAVTLPDASIEAFALFNRFLSRGTIYRLDDSDTDALREPVPENARLEDDEEPDLTTEYNLIVECWKLGERLMSVSFKDAMVDALAEKARLDSEDIESQLYLASDIYEASHAKSKIRKLLVDVAIWKWPVETMADWPEEEEKCVEFFFDMAKELHAMRTVKDNELDKDPPYWDLKTCIYHEHELDDSDCYKKMF